MTKLTTVEGIGDVYAGKLMEAGIETTEQLLEKGSTVKGRKQIEQDTEIAHALVLKWVNHCDLFRIKGVGEEYADLLEVAGVDTVPELAQRNASNLYNKMAEANKEKSLVRQLPVQASVEDWVNQAKELPRVVTY
jgi:predicted flap endonuclease-1-like 5' DNA nuclease